MPCCAILIVLFIGPRFGILALGLFTSYFEKPFDGLLLPVLGFLFMPFTTLAYAWAINVNGSVSGLYLAVTALAALVDLGVVGGGASKRNQRD